MSAVREYANAPAHVVPASITTALALHDRLCDDREPPSEWCGAEVVKWRSPPGVQRHRCYPRGRCHRGNRSRLHEISADGEFIHDPGYKWECSCGANNAGLGRPLTAQLLHSAWSHFDAHLDPAAVPLHGPLARWYRGGQEPDLDALFELEVARILGSAPELPVEVVHVCGECGESFEISESDPHWTTGRGPICPKAHKP